MQFVISFAYFALLGFLITRLSFFRNIPQLPTRLLLVFFTLKVLAGSMLIFIYTRYYEDPLTADVYKYFYDGKIMFDAIKDQPLDYLRMLTGIDASAPHLAKYYEEMNFWFRPWESPVYNDNRLVIRFNAFAFLFSFGHIFVHNVFINFLSFTGLVALYKFLIRHIDRDKLPWLAPGIFLFPSLLFWGSGILKEGLLLWALGFWMLSLDNILTQRKSLILPSVMLIVLTGFLVLLKPYTLVFWLPFITVFYFSRNFRPIQLHLSYIGAGVLLVAGGIILTSLFSSYDVLQVIAGKQNDFINQSLVHDAGSILHTRYLQPDLVMMAVEFVRGFFNTLLRPHLFEAYSFVTLMAAVENAFIIFLLLYLVWKFDRKKLFSPGIQWAGFWFVLLFMGFVGLVSPAHGGLVRYKIPALPFLWLFFVQLTQLPRIDGDIFNYISSKKIFK
jgi:hypothetical protein